MNKFWKILIIIFSLATIGSVAYENIKGQLRISPEKMQAIQTILVKNIARYETEKLNHNALGGENVDADLSCQIPGVSKLEGSSVKFLLKGEDLSCTVNGGTWKTYTFTIFPRTYELNANWDTDVWFQPVKFSWEGICNFENWKNAYTITKEVITEAMYEKTWNMHEVYKQYPKSVVFSVGPKGVEKGAVCSIIPE
jgi:hypothetical protein